MPPPRSSKSKKIAEFALFLITWVALLLQLGLLKHSFLNFISYFTVLSNLLVALSLTAILFLSRTKLGFYFSSITVQTGIVLNIFIVGLVYNAVLRGIWQPKAWYLVADNLLHVVVPVLYTLYWIFFVQKGTLTWKKGLSWTYFPLIYLIYSLIRGHYVNWYPYPFLNVTELGYMQVLANAGFVVVAFLFFGAVLLWIDHLLRTDKTVSK